MRRVVFLLAVFLIAYAVQSQAQSPASYPYQPTDRIQFTPPSECTTVVQCVGLTPRLYLDDVLTPVVIPGLIGCQGNPGALLCTTQAIGKALADALNAWTVPGHQVSLELFSTATGASAKSVPFVSAGPSLSAPTITGVVR